MLDAQTASRIARGGDTLRPCRASAEEALRTVPMLFAIPGNHDWFDGLRTFGNYIVEKSWLGGWLMPQRSSYFTLQLPFNWFILCCDTGNTQDIDTTQRNYFLQVIEHYMDEHSCVILAAHEPGWLYNAMERRDTPLQPELDYLVNALGTRLRLRMAGDIHHYSRHIPIDALSEAATLVVSGGGGGFLHGARNDRIIAQGTPYRRTCAFPRRNTYMTITSRLWGFRLVNWKFDIFIGCSCFLLVLSPAAGAKGNAAARERHRYHLRLLRPLPRAHVHLHDVHGVDSEGLVALRGLLPHVLLVRGLGPQGALCLALCVRGFLDGVDGVYLLRHAGCRALPAQVHAQRGAAGHHRGRVAQHAGGADARVRDRPRAAPRAALRRREHGRARAAPAPEDVLRELSVPGVLLGSEGAGPH
ncbi:hypothetical protein STCU_11990 [Strigomonas culicis]|uniref:Calcineurin-like phosphoesterase domain-containing protein n=1 Tax=Strigomonas culicis TaxID=28005 RepID=S9TGK5_9TRYP|nr:hypothetical protein STCU_11990 [Strigomonas culicis]|eukprot:EPY15483.1 hypothetical protein STCU_11990 [Strigomonas culicis]